MMNPPVDMLEIYRADAVALRLAIERDARCAQREAMRLFATALVNAIARMFARAPARVPHSA